MADLVRTSWTAYATHYYDTPYVPAKAIDGNTSTIWHPALGAGYPENTYPFEWWVDMGTAQTFNYITMLGRNADQTPREFEVYVSDDGSSWGSALARISWPSGLAIRVVVFPSQTKRWIKVKFLDGQGHISCIAEFNAGFDAAKVGDLSVIALATAEGTVGTAYSQPALSITQGTTPYTCSVISGALPNGTTINGAGVVSGTPTAPGGAFNATIRVADSGGQTRDVATAYYIFKPGSPSGGATIWQISAVGRIEFIQSPSYAAALQLYYAPDYSAVGESGFPSEIFYNFLVPPVYLSQYGGELALQNFTFISFAPTTTDFSTFAVWLAVAGSVHGDGDGSNELRVYRFWILADYTDGTRTYTYPARAQSRDLSGSVENSESAIDGNDSTYASVSRSHFTGVGSAPQLRLDRFGLLPPPEVICDNPPGGAVGQSYTHAFPASSGLAPYTWSITAGALPPGIELNPATGAIAGIPTTAGTFSFTVTVTDDTGSTDSVDCSIPIAEPGNLWLDLWVWRELFRLDSVEQVITFPPGYERALMLQLAWEFGRQYPGHNLQSLKPKLAQAVAQIDVENVSNSQALEELPPPEDVQGG